VTLRGEKRVLVPKLVTGCKIWHIRPESVFYPKVAFQTTMANLPDDAQVVMLFGEIDCREGLLLAVDKCKYDSLEEGIQATVDIYIAVLRSLIARGMELFVHPVPPVLNETRHIVMPFNAALKRTVIQTSKGMTPPPFPPSHSPRGQPDMQRRHSTDWLYCTSQTRNCRDACTGWTFWMSC
jgi:hypothetical protein